jgi:hypothetical protein
VSNRTALQNAIIDYVVGMEGAGNVIDVNAAAVKLSSAYPQSGPTIDEICRLIEDAAVRSGAALLSGTRDKN